MNLLFIGDVVGQPGLRAIADQLPGLRQRLKLDLVVANAENVADGVGVTKKTANELFAAGVDVLSNGNHAWDKKEALEYITTEPRLLRPHNYPDGTPGTGWHVATTGAGAQGRHSEPHGQRLHAPAPGLPVRGRRPGAGGEAGRRQDGAGGPARGSDQRENGHGLVSRRARERGGGHAHACADRRRARVSEAAPATSPTSA
jgi:hypothetical protein